MKKSDFRDEFTVVFCFDTLKAVGLQTGLFAVHAVITQEKVMLNGTSKTEAQKVATLGKMKVARNAKI